MSRALCWKKRTHDLSACADPEQDHRGKGQVHKGTFGTRGKIGISDAIINKTERLTDEEYEEIKKHPVIGAKILSDISEMPDIQDGGREQKAATSHVLLVRGLLSRCTNLLT